MTNALGEYLQRLYLLSNNSLLQPGGTTIQDFQTLSFFLQALRNPILHLVYRSDRLINGWVGVNGTTGLRFTILLSSTRREFLRVRIVSMPTRDDVTYKTTGMNEYPNGGGMTQEPAT